MTSLEKFLLLVAAPTVFSLALLEGLVLWRRGGYDWRAFALSIADYLGRIAITVLLPLTIAMPLLKWAAAHRLFDFTLDDASAIALLFIGQEFCYYWYHRAAHRVRWFWLNHSVHHSPNELNLAAALRIGLFGRLTGTPLFFVPMVWLGFDFRTVAAVLTLNLLYQFWIHATWIPKLGWLEGWLNTPSAHRVHHASNPEYLDANYGGVLLVFDRLFGTYRPERNELPCRYGLVQPLTSHNPLVLWFSPWAGLWRDLARARGLRAVLGHLFGPPGWSPDGPGHTTEALRAQQAARAHAAPRGAAAAE